MSNPRPFNMQVVSAFRRQPEVTRSMMRKSEAFFHVSTWLVLLRTDVSIAGLPQGGKTKGLGVAMREALIRAIREVKGEPAEAPATPQAEPQTWDPNAAILEFEADGSLSFKIPGAKINLPYDCDTDLAWSQPKSAESASEAEAPLPRSVAAEYSSGYNQRYTVAGQLRKIRPDGNLGWDMPRALKSIFVPPEEVEEGDLPDVEQCPNSTKWQCVRIGCKMYKQPRDYFAVRRHALQAHEKDPFKKAFPFHCDACGRGVNGPAPLRRHMRTHIPIQLRTDWAYNCAQESCGYRTDARHAWQDHVKWHERATAGEGSLENIFFTALAKAGIQCSRHKPFHKTATAVELHTARAEDVHAGHMICYVDGVVLSCTNPDGSTSYVPETTDLITESDELAHKRNGSYYCIREESSRAFKIWGATRRTTILVRVINHETSYHGPDAVTVPLKIKAQRTAAILREIIATEIDRVAKGIEADPVSLYYIYYDTYQDDYRLRVADHSDFYRPAKDCIKLVYNKPEPETAK